MKNIPMLMISENSISENSRKIGLFLSPYAGKLFLIKFLTYLFLDTVAEWLRR